MVEYEIGCGKKRMCRVPLIITSHHDAMQIRESTSRAVVNRRSRRDSQVGFANSQREIMISILVRGYRD